MRAVAFMGSPRKGGCTATVLDWVGEELDALGYGMERIDIVDYRVKGCISCYRCQDVPDEPGCVFKDEDDADELWTKAIASDLIILASPLYMWGFSGQIKVFLDRAYAIVKNYGSGESKSLISGRRIALLMTCMGPIDGNADVMEHVFERFAGYTRMENVGRLIVPYCTGPGALADGVKDSAREFARKIVKA